MGTTSFKYGLKRLAYASGLLAWWHRRRNAQALTVFMFHRVLPKDSAAYAHAEREFTFSAEGFGRCLDFIRRHYAVVSADEARAAIADGVGLPPCPALITFDDGWRDTLVHAYPELKARGLSALVFLATEAIESPQPAWWQDTLVQILAAPDRAAALRLRLGLPEAEGRNRENDHAVAGKVAALPLSERLALLSEYAASGSVERQMLTEEEIRAADRSCIEFGAHGHTHAPLTAVAEPLAELRKSRAVLGALGAVAPAMSFPHGAYTERLLDLAREADFSLSFTSDPELLDLRSSAQGRRIGRIHVPENEWTADRDGIAFPKLATFLFFRPRTAP